MEVTDHTSASVADDSGRGDQSESGETDNRGSAGSRSRAGGRGGPIGRVNDSSPGGALSAAGTRLMRPIPGSG